MARSENVVESHIKNPYLWFYCLVFEFGKTTCDQTSKDSNQLCHVCATHKNPKTFPILALALYLLINTDKMKGG